MGGNPQAKADKNNAKIEKRKLGLQRKVDKFEDQIRAKQRPLIDKALEASHKVANERNRMGKLEVQQAKDTSGILSQYAQNTNANTVRLEKGLFDSVQAPLFTSADLPRISMRMAQLDQLFN